MRAELFGIYHWSRAEVDALPLSEFHNEHQAAIEYHNRVNSPPKESE